MCMTCYQARIKITYRKSLIQGRVLCDKAFKRWSAIYLSIWIFKVFIFSRIFASVTRRPSSPKREFISRATTTSDWISCVF